MVWEESTLGFIVLGAVVLGCLIFIFYTVINYVEQSTPITNRIRELHVDLEFKRSRLAEHQDRVESLKVELPGLRNAVARLKKWLELLRGQKSQVEAERNQSVKRRGVSRAEVLEQVLAHRQRDGR